MNIQIIKAKGGNHLKGPNVLVRTTALSQKVVLFRYPRQLYQEDPRRL